MVDTAATSVTTVPEGVPAGMPSPSEKVTPVGSTGALARVQTICAGGPLPTGGLTQVQPEGAVIDWNVASSGIGIVSAALGAAFDPLFRTVTA